MGTTNSTLYSKTNDLKSRLDNLNRLILKDIDIIKKGSNISSSDLEVINNNITNYSNSLKQINRDITGINSLDLQNYYKVANNNLNKLKILFSDLNKNIPNSTQTSASVPAAGSVPAASESVAYIPASSESATSVPSSPHIANIPNALPINKKIYINKNMINSSDTSKLYSTVEGFTDYISAYYNNMPIFEGLTDTDMSNITALMKKEKELLDQLADFNIKYERYIHCNDPKINKDCVSGREPTSQELINKMDIINGIIGDMRRTPVSQTTDIQSNHNNILSDYDKVIKLRYDLDMKVKQLYDPENSKIADFKYSYDSTIYSGIIISALATSMLYYIFTEL